MALGVRVRESATATKTFHALRIERRVLVAPARTIAIENISTIGVGTHAASRPRGFYWLAAAIFAVMALGSMRPDFSFGPLAPTPFTLLLGGLVLIFAGLALRPDDKTHYLLISSNDGVLTRFAAPDRHFLEEVRLALTDKINRGDEQATFNVNFEKSQLEPLGAGDARPPSSASGVALGGYANGSAKIAERSSQSTQPAPPRASASNAPRSMGRGARQGPALGSPGLGNGAVNGAAAPETFVDFATVLPSIVEMHRFYARQPGTQHLEQRLSELELLMRSGTPTVSQKSRVRELSAEMSQILQAYPQAVELFDHVTGLVA